MEILVERKWKKPNYTIGVMSIDGKRFCETLEDVDRNLNSSMTVEQIKAIKKSNETNSKFIKIKNINDYKIYVDININTKGSLQNTIKEIINEKN